jgi:hypothetical protein
VPDRRSPLLGSLIVVGGLAILAAAVMIQRSASPDLDVSVAPSEDGLGA